MVEGKLLGANCIALKGGFDLNGQSATLNNDAISLNLLNARK